MYEKIVLVTRKTRLAELVERFNTREQARFYIEHAGGNFTEYQAEDVAYQRSLEVLRRQLDVGLKVQVLDRSLVPTYLFSNKDVIVTAGQDGLVANTARYVGQQPIVAVNPDPTRFDGVLLPFAPHQVRTVLGGVVEQKAKLREVTLAEIKLDDGQRLLAFNDLFIGAKSHVSARYRLSVGSGKAENQSSSGVLVSTGVGSTGWLSSVFNMAAGVAAFSGGRLGDRLKLTWEDPHLVYMVREPFISKHSQANLVAGLLEPEVELKLESLMPSGGVIFGDGMETDFLNFNSGAIAHVRAADQRARLVAA
jgi:NAD kinase